MNGSNHFVCEMNHHTRLASPVVRVGLMLLLCGCYAANLCGIVFADDADRPNILYINADDLGVKDVGYNDTAFRTPNIDRLALDGMTFTNAYAPAANCAPSRACVLSGLWSPRHGVYTVGNSDRGRRETRRLIPVANTPYLSSTHMTMAEALRSGGYATIHLGKYHIGKDPLSDGFDVNVGGDHSGSPSGGYYSPWSRSEMAKWTDTVDKPTHRMDVFVREAIKFMNENRDRPQFVHFSPYLVHSPKTAVPEYVDDMKGRGIDPIYGSMVCKLDEAVGSLLKAVDDLGLSHKTVVVFSSDNGGIAAIHTQAPFRGGKGSYYEGGVREPLVVKWPGKVHPGTRSAEVVNTLDLYPTFMDLANVDPPANIQLDGQSLMPLLEQTDGWQTATQYWHFPVYLQAYAGAKDDARDVLFRTRPGSAIREGRWKLHEYFEDGALELYDLEVDPGERQNLAEAMPEQAKRLHNKLANWRKRVSAPVPTKPNPFYDADVERQLMTKAVGKSDRKRRPKTRRD